MAERAHPEDNGFKDKYWGFIKNPYKKMLLERYTFCNQFINKKNVCDIPCGVGWGTSLLKKYSSIVGIDVSQEAIDYAQKHYQNKQRRFVIGNMTDIPLGEDSLDVVLCLEGFEHVELEIGKKFLQETKRVLKHNGLLIMTCPVLNEHGERTTNPYHLYEYPEEDLINLLNFNFRILDIKRLVGPDSPIYRCVVSNIKNSRYI